MKATIIKPSIWQEFTKDGIEYCLLVSYVLNSFCLPKFNLGTLTEDFYKDKVLEAESVEFIKIYTGEFIKIYTGKQESYCEYLINSFICQLIEESPFNEEDIILFPTDDYLNNNFIFNYKKELNSNLQKNSGFYNYIDYIKMSLNKDKKRVWQHFKRQLLENKGFLNKFVFDNNLNYAVINETYFVCKKEDIKEEIESGQIEYIRGDSEFIDDINELLDSFKMELE